MSFLIKNTKPLIGFLLVSSLFMMGFTYFQLTKFEIDLKFSTLETETLTCDVIEGKRAATLRVAVLNEFTAKRFLGALCENPIVKKQFNKVTVGWREGSDLMDIASIYHAQHDFFIASSQSIIAQFINDQKNYTPISKHPDFYSYFISLDFQPDINPSFFLGRTIGLLRSPLSAAGHIKPFEVLKSVGLDESNLDIVFFESHRQLREALIYREVDVIASYYNSNTDQSLGDVNLYKIQPALSGSTWFMTNKIINTQLACVLYDLVHEMAQNNSHEYFSQLIDLGDLPCKR